MGDWKVIVPAATTNLCTNPSFETGSTGWATHGTNALAPSTDQSRFGIYSAKCTYQDSSLMGTFTPTLPTINTVYILTCRVYIPSSWTGDYDIIMGGNSYVGSSEVYTRYWTTGDAKDEWVQIETELTVAADIVGSITVKQWIAHGSTFPNPGEYMYFDGFQIERVDSFTTYCDGDQPGCVWDGAPHASESTRSAAYRGGGFVKDLKDDYNFAVRDVIGAGMPPVTLSHDSYSLLPGGELNGVKTEIRPFTLVANITGTGDDCSIHPPRQTLEKLFAHDTYPKSGDGWQPIRLRYTGADVIKEADVHYARGLEGALTTEALKSGVEIVAVGFEQPSVFWKEPGNGSQVLDSNDSTGFRVVAGRLTSTGQWDPLGPPNAAGAYVTVYDMAYGPDGALYIGGDFVNFDNIAAADYIVRYDLEAGTYSALAAGFNGLVRGVAFAPDGDMYAVGSFTDGGGDNDYISRWDGAAWNAVGVPTAGGAAITSIYDVIIDQEGNVYICGDFTTFANIANADYVAMWDGAAWNAVGTPAAGGAVITTCNEMAIDSNNSLYVVGQFSDFANLSAADYIAKWDGTSWVDVGFTWGAIALIDTIAIAGDDTVYVGGNFTGAPGDYIVSYNGTAWNAVGTGTNNVVRRIRIAPDGLLYVTGAFTEAGGISLADRTGVWNGSSWSRLDLDLPGAPSVWGIVFSPSDPVIVANYDIFLGFSTTDTGYFAGLVTATNDGNTPTYPQLVVYRSGGTEAILQTLRNETTGLELLLDYSLLDGETLTIDLNPQAKTIISSMFGSRPDAMLAGSDFGEWALLPDDNEVTCFVSTAGAPTVVAYLIWPILYKGID